MFLHRCPTQLVQAAQPQRLIVTGGVDKTSGVTRNDTTTKRLSSVIPVPYITNELIQVGIVISPRTPRFAWLGTDFRCSSPLDANFGA